MPPTTLHRQRPCQAPSLPGFWPHPTPLFSPHPPSKVLSTTFSHSAARHASPTPHATRSCSTCSCTPSQDLHISIQNSLTSMSDDYVPWGQREGWSDVVPLQQDDGPADLPVIQIPYTAEFKDTMNYFRALVHKQEYSRRALELCTAAIDLSPPNYTAWRFRRAILEALNDPKLLEEDFEYTEDLATENSKNYQIWHHRQWLVTHTNDASRELDFTALLINDDSKNYHAWSYRQWVIKKFDLWEKEMQYLDHLLTQDLRNNSAWNMRYYVFTHAPQHTSLQNEINTAFHWISKSPNNQSPWNYIKGLFAKLDYADFPDIEAKCVEALTKYPVCPNPHILLIDIYERRNTQDSLALAKESCDKLASSLDSVHKKYWLFRRSELDKKAAK